MFSSTIQRPDTELSPEATVSHELSAPTAMYGMLSPSSGLQPARAGRKLIDASLLTSADAMPTKTSSAGAALCPSSAPSGK